MRRIVQASYPYFRKPYEYNTKEGRVYLRLVLYETQKRNVVEGYTLTRLSPVGEDTEQREELRRMLCYIDPCIKLSNVENNNVSEMAEWYKETFGVPGTPEFEENVKKMNEKLHATD